MERLSAVEGSPSSAGGLLAEAIRYCRAGAYEEAVRRLLAVLHAPGGLTPGERSTALRHCADARRGQSRWAESFEFAAAALAAAEEAGDADLWAEAKNAEAAIYHAQGRLDEAETRYAAALARAPSVRVRGILHQNLGTLAALRRDYARAEAHFALSLQEFREAAYLRGIIMAQINAGWVRSERGESAAALPFLLEARRGALQEQDWDLYADASINLAQAYIGCGNLEAALTSTIEVLGHFTHGRNVRRQAECYRLLGRIHQLQGDADAARAILRRGLSLAQCVGADIEAAEIEAALAGL
ncbi:MAG: hypothetical protein IRZ00_16305 [Gemmatimonadetes bacterium]|nr:hypothetical protein [Gemmatimonadota bacterium]